VPYKPLFIRGPTKTGQAHSVCSLFNVICQQSQEYGQYLSCWMAHKIQGQTVAMIFNHWTSKTCVMVCTTSDDTASGLDSSQRPRPPASNTGPHTPPSSDGAGSTSPSRSTNPQQPVRHLACPSSQTGTKIPLNLPKSKARTLPISNISPLASAFGAFLGFALGLPQS